MTQIGAGAFVPIEQIAPRRQLGALHDRPGREGPATEPLSLYAGARHLTEAGCESHTHAVTYRGPDPVWRFGVYRCRGSGKFLAQMG